MKTKIILGLLATSALAAAGAGQAQTVQAEPQAPAAAAAPPPKNATPEPAALAEVVVTAQRRSESVQRAALAVSVVGSEQLAAKGIVNLQEITKLAPALKVAGISGGQTQVTIRGVGSFVGNPFSEAGVAVNYDGVYLARSNAPNGLFYDLDRVEILKGPQGTLYGRNATAGALNIVPKPPVDHFEAGATGEIGNYDLYRADGYLNVPLAQNVDLRLAGQGITRRGYLSDGYNDEKGYAGRAQLKIKPTDTLSIVLGTDYSKQEGKGVASVFSPFLNLDDPYRGPTSPESNGLLAAVSSAIGVPLPPFKSNGFLNNKAWGVNATIDWSPGPVNVTFLPAYRETTGNYLHYGAGYPVTDDQTAKQVSLELRIASAMPGPLKWLVGGYYFKEDSETFLSFDQGVTSAALNIPTLDSESYAFFGQATYALTDRFRLTGGVRYTSEEKTLDGTQTTPLPPVPAGFPAPASVFYGIACPSPAVAAPSAGTCTSPTVGDETFSRVTWKGGVEYDLGPQSLLYASISTGFKAGGFYPSLAPNTFRPEKLTAYTIGSKNRFLDNTLQVNAEAYYWVYDDKQVSHIGPIRPAGYTLITENAGKAELGGVELEIIWSLGPHDLLTIQPQYEHSEYKKFLYSLSVAPGGAPATACPSTRTGTDGSGFGVYSVNCSGRVVTLSPEWVLGLNYQHTFDLPGGASLRATAATRFESNYFSGEEYLPGERQSSETTSDIDLTYVSTDTKYRVTAYVQNLEDGAVIQSSFVQPTVGSPLVFLRPPRTFGVRVSARY